jgi:6-phosphofructokinase 1
MKKIGVLTGGGDAPGMNPAIRAVVRTAICRSMQIVGIERGYRGLYEKSFLSMDSRSVSGIINIGGTILKTSRFPEFKNPSVRRECLNNLKKESIEALVVIGGDGTAKGAYALFAEFGFPVVLIPASIDNDVYGTDYTVGFDTAVNTAVTAIDKIRDTATSHERTFIIEVMGREKGNLAVEIALACGAEIVLIPEAPVEKQDIVNSLKEQEKKGKKSSLIILAEGAGKAADLTDFLEKEFPEKQVRYSVLGYIQRGGTPTFLSRKLATEFGFKAVEALVENKGGNMIGISGCKYVLTPLSVVTATVKLPCLQDREIIKYMSI